MGRWTDEELRAIDGAEELRIASRRTDGTLSSFVTIWHTAVGGELYVRSAHGPENGWFRRARNAGAGRIEAGGVARDVTFEPAEPAVHPDLDAALHYKYDSFGVPYVDAIAGDDVHETTLAVRPID